MTPEPSRHCRRLLWPLALCPLMLLVPVGSGTAAGAERPDFSGTWEINDALSDDPRDKLFEEMQKSRGPGGFGRGGRFGGPVGRGPGGGGGMGGPPGVGGGRDRMGGGKEGGPPGGEGGPGEERRRRMRERLNDLHEGARRLMITHDGPQFAIRYADDRERVLHTDGREERYEFAGDIWEAHAKWKKKSKIVVKTESTRGRKVKEIYEFSEDGTRLNVTVETEGGGRMPSFTFRRVYDRVETG